MKCFRTQIKGEETDPSSSEAHARVCVCVCERVITVIMR